VYRKQIKLFKQRKQLETGTCVRLENKNAADVKSTNRPTKTKEEES
jgi:hypothetical protein